MVIFPIVNTTITSLRLIIILTLLLLIGSSFNMQTYADTVKTNKNDHYHITRDYYNSLITSDLPVAELGMLVNILPKGGDIHHHFIGAIYVETFLDYVKKEDFYIDPNSYQILTKPTKTSMTVDAIRADIQKYNQLLSIWSTGDFNNHYHVHLPPDERFFNCFKYVGWLEDYIVQDVLIVLKKRAKAENVQYIETIFPQAPISTNTSALDELNKLTSNTDDLIIIQLLEKAILLLDQDNVIHQAITHYSTMVTDKSEDIDDDQFTMRFQPYVYRDSRPSMIFSGLYSAFSLAQNNRKIVGVNIVGAENSFAAINDYTLHMKMFRFLKQKFPNVKLSLHAGELALGQVPPEGLRHHIRDAIFIAGANRIGHGVDIMHESNPYQLINALLEKNILIEINLTSNEFILGVVGDNHPVKLYMQYGVPIAICSDDPGISRNNLTKEYLLFISRYKPSYDQLKQVVYYSIKYSFLTEEEKKKQLNLLDKKFILFEETIALFIGSAVHRK